ncbi:hypothetical protein BO78DRAFT_400011 [Aspergillus sclerotiicarbonarius CBS 121057]|uniref:Uncharacterized protein n=1 Tax=Aspergillus sclerotiicarbonarius (strain CBS 121057 / IBT 28362) TaxID=1448318 RepID=A0A319E4K3_ASPSB|nr:hypothetical protein BO78DRAFT_400011 [Aspergillus sclerotiicarbonarius CBS 121057]
MGSHSRIEAVSVEPGLLTLGYEFFRDTGRMNAQFISGDSRVLLNEALSEVTGRVDLVIASQFLHPFERDG